MESGDADFYKVKFLLLFYTFDIYLIYKCFCINEKELFKKKVDDFEVRNCGPMFSKSDRFLDKICYVYHIKRY